MYKKVFITAALFVASSAQAATLSQWNFNSTPPDAATGTGTVTPAIGSGTASLLGGVTSPSFNNGAGSSDMAADNSGWQTTGYKAAGIGDKTAGVQFKLSTVGYKDIVFSYDLRHSNTSSRYEQLQYSLNGTTFVDAVVFDGNKGDTWFNARSFDLSSIAGANNNADLTFRVLATFAPATSNYAASDATKTYAAAGTWRFDMVTVSGVSAVPEPDSWLMLFAGLGLLGCIAHRRLS